MFFIIGTGRCGTTTLARVLSQSPNCRCLHEPKPWFVREASLYVYGEYTPNKIKSDLKSSRPASQWYEYGESNQKLSFLIPILAETFPKAQFIWLVRDGRDVVVSTVARGWYKPVEVVERENPDLGNGALTWHQNRLNGYRMREFTSHEWNSMSRFEKCCWRWARVNLERYEVPYRKLRIEDIATTIDSVACWLGVAPPLGGFRISTYNSAKQPVRPWKKWTKEERGFFERWCGEQMDKMYPDWKDETGKWQTRGVDNTESARGNRMTQALVQMRGYIVAARHSIRLPPDGQALFRKMKSYF